MRALRPLALAGLTLALALSVAACSAGSEPEWTYAPATPAPPSEAPTAAPSGEPSAAPSGGEMVIIDIAAQNIQYDRTELSAPANQPFQIRFTNNDSGVPHNVAIHEGSPTGPEVWKGDIFNGVETRVYDVPALPPGTYGFICTVHPNMTGTLVVK